MVCLYANGRDPLGMEKKRCEIFVTLTLMFSCFLESSVEVVEVRLEVFSTPPSSGSLCDFLLFSSFWLA